MGTGFPSWSRHGITYFDGKASTAPRPRLQAAIPPSRRAAAFNDVYATVAPATARRPQH